ncbi:unnamed protein product [Chrysodeixis includens]|uniref:Putative ionotropic receptor ligand binding domain-containing protein n=1 Tax=Chrysodeixis includens TaxID=689277 RepID=A0A9N8L0M8_CHRIL|nr:unnamed protein product [Chrysodeixis includens]
MPKYRISVCDTACRSGNNGKIHKYFMAGPSFAYIDMNPEDDEILRGLHATATTPLVLRLPTARLPVRYSGYIITALNVEAFCDGFKDMLKDLKWNPSARFLIVIKSIKESELKTIFDVLLKQHVINVVVVNGTDDAHLYTYNPFDHYACGSKKGSKCASLEDPLLGVSAFGIYFIARPSFAYVDMSPDDDEILRELHSKATEPLVLRLPTARLPVRYSGYIITALNVEAFCDGFKDMLKDLKWNPSARFLIVIKSIKESELKTIFDVLLKQHVINVVVVNGTDDALLYTYNPFDHYACGRYYKHIEALGPCLQTDSNLFPNKLVTGLRNCTLRAFVPHQPPYVINPALVINVVVVNATEDPLLYTYNPYDNYNCGKRYDSVINYGKCSRAVNLLDLYPEKAVTGLQNCTLDVVISHWPPFTIVYSRDSNNISSALAKGLEPYLLRLMGETQGFKVNIIDDYDSENISTVSSDLRATGTLRKLQDNEVDAVIGGMLLIPSRALAFSFIDGHLGYTDEIRFIVKLSAFYQSSLVSLTTNPLEDYQISTEEDIAKYHLKPCFSKVMGTYYVESIQSKDEFSGSAECSDLLDSVSFIVKEFIATFLVYHT